VHEESENDSTTTDDDPLPYMDGTLPLETTPDAQVEATFIPFEDEHAMDGLAHGKLNLLIIDIDKFVQDASE
jgi:hypothetical protein